MNEVAAPVVGALSKADEATKNKVKQDLERMVEPFITDKGLALDFTALVVSGDKAA